MAKSLINKLVEKPKKSEENLIDSQAIVDKIKEGYALQRKASFKKRDLIYMKILKKSFAFLVYESKNSHELSLFPVKLTDHYKNFINYFFDWMREVKKASDDGLLPENPYRSNSKVCKGCDFETVCRTKPKGDIKIAPRKDLE